MVFYGDRMVIHLDSSKSWHLAFEDFENNGQWVLRLYVEDMEDGEFDFVTEDGFGFKDKKPNEYCYALFDYAEEVMAAIQNEIETSENGIIHITEIIKQVRAKWYILGKKDADEA